ncbi:MAG TPA: GAF domain-containing SpoIIE family protein phosphatase [Polyangia bacterium]
MSVIVAIVVAVAVLAAGFLAAETARRRRRFTAGVVHAARDATLWQFIQRALDTWSLEVIERELAAALAEGLGLGKVALLSPGDKGWTAHALDGDGDGALPPPRTQNVFGWFRHNPNVVLATDLADGRYGGMRLPLVELCQTYGADALLPLLHRDQLFGVVAAGGLGRPLDEAERDFVTRLHLEAASLAASAQLFNEATLKLSLEHEVVSAEAVQQALLPHTGLERVAGITLASHYRGVPGAAGHLFAAYDRDGRALIVMGDVAGRGVAASMLVAVAKGCCEGSTLADPGAVLTALNRAIFRPGARRPEMRCLAVLFDPATRAVQVASGGAPFPYIVARRDGAVQLGCIVARGPVLGDLPAASFTVTTQTLRPEDTLVLATPGLVLADDARRVGYGDRRLQKALRRAAAHEPGWLLEEIVSDLDRHTAGRPPREEALLVLARAE